MVTVSQSIRFVPTDSVKRTGGRSGQYIILYERECAVVIPENIEGCVLPFSAL